MKIMFVFLGMLLAAVCLLSPCSEANASVSIAAPASEKDTVTGLVGGFYTRLVDVMKDGDKLGFAGRYKRLEPTITASFNMPLMTRMAVGTTWAHATSDEQQQLVSAFSDFSVANYANQFKSFDGEKFSVLDAKPVASGYIVETSLQPKDGAAVTINYLVEKDERGAWRIVDVFLNGSISELAARRSEFTSIAKRDGIAALVNSLGEKSRQMGPS